MKVISEQLLLRAAQPTIRAILDLQKRVSKASREVLDEIGGKFSVPGYTVEKLKKTVGVDDNWFFAVFHQEVGITAWSFIRECRLEMASRLLRDTSLPIPDICILVGYASLSQFRRNFRLWCGLTPSRYRQCVRRVKSQAGTLLDDAITWIYRQRCRRGELSDDEARELIEYLEKLYGPLE